jgi:DeoR/GlpR family transcriptional regulator of sugar metabolism
LIVFL